MQTGSIKTPIIREERPADYEAVEALVAAAFLGIPESDGTENLLVKRLRKSDAFIPGLSLVAEEGGRLIGHIMFTRISIEGPGAPLESLSLAPVAVEPGAQNRGIGSLLVREGLRRAKELGFASVIVLGHKWYYPRFGFRPAGDFGIVLPFDGVEDFSFAMELRDGALAPPPPEAPKPEVEEDSDGDSVFPATRRHRVVRYPKEFFGD